MTKIKNTRFLEETPSTNSYLKEHLQKELFSDGFTVYAGFQTAGRGQRGNSWESEPSKNLLFSIILYPNQIEANKQFLISEMISLALKDILSAYTSDITIKWPNDIYWQNKKIAGILIENAITAGKLDYSIIGVGLNVNQDHFLSDAPNPTSLKQITGQDHDIENILKSIQDRLHYYKTVDPHTLHQRYKESLFRKNGWHLFSDGKSSFLAQIATVGVDGVLSLELKDASVRHYSFKEIKFLID